LSKRLQRDVAKFVEAFYFGCKVKLEKPIYEKQFLKSGKIRVFGENLPWV